MINTDTKQLIMDAKNICVIPSPTNEPESLAATLALFYTLKELHKNVNLLIEDFPEKLNFLVPSLDFISSPKNFVISIPKTVADVSQIYYEKNEENVKIHLTIDKGNIKKDNISFYFTESKPDLVITLGIQNFQKQLENKLDSYGFLLGAPIVNIDNHQGNTKYGQINLVEDQSLCKTTLDIITSIDENLVKKNVAHCILAGLVSYYENFKSVKTTPQVLKIAAQLMEQGADYQQIMDNLYKTTPQEMLFLTEIFKNLKNEKGFYVATLTSDDFYHFGQSEASNAMEKIRGLGIQNDLLVLWKSHASNPTIKGFFYSKKHGLLHKVAGHQQEDIKNDWIFLVIPQTDIIIAKEKITTLLS